MDKSEGLRMVIGRWQEFAQSLSKELDCFCATDSILKAVKELKKTSDQKVAKAKIIKQTVVKMHCENCYCTTELAAYCSNCGYKLVTK